ncbi:MAG: AmmeMemoRadiSam system protein B [Gammaproteobacteria bacterium]|nr:AmmeMemoRadiSam system protein B [Gammaproteobacteria bacterium]NIR98118.1 AmmeMemoRadiSam system protein B [Gammaproteobacteria bacterium]NIT63810.1 AmmeMemoRadiSam system protein B [Gammaproteobacteria bacterium]NIV20760.1 AmmeMemoRadiSam system protein B [Gammaproteobacteria bacterium]NIX10009.1 AmmeMemoRadiSam system protein B [Gammaproteobacteria bacterium]
MTHVRHPAVAGMFYPDDANALRAMIREYLDGAAAAGPPPKALIAPHAGYVYSGTVAASAYARVAPLRGTVRRVVLLGPAHRVPLRGLAASGADQFLTPLGPVNLDRQAIDALLALPQVRISDEAHELEHSLEVHLPFLQEVLGGFELIPLVVGDASHQEVDEVLETLWGGPETLIVISSDLSHYHDYDTARAMDRRTSQAIEALRTEDISYDQACGRSPVSGLLVAARRHGLHARTVDLRNSGDTAGPRDQVVGYGAYVFEH